MNGKPEIKPEEEPTKWKKSKWSGTTQDLAVRLGMTTTRVNTLIKEGKFGVVIQSPEKGFYKIPEHLIEAVMRKDYVHAPHPDLMFVRRYTAEEAREMAEKWFKEHSLSARMKQWKKSDKIKYENKKTQMVENRYRMLLNLTKRMRKKLYTDGEKSKILSLPLDIITFIDKKLTEEQSEFFVERYVEYSGVIDLTNPSVSFVVINLIQDEMQIIKLQDHIRMRADYDKELEESLNKAEQRWLSKTAGLKLFDKSGRLETPGEGGELGADEV